MERIPTFSWRGYLAGMFVFLIFSTITWVTFLVILGNEDEILPVPAVSIVRARGAIVSFLFAGYGHGHVPVSFIPVVSVRECYCLIHGYDCHTELLNFDSSLEKDTRIHFNKQLIVMKYLPYYEWVMFADSDIIFNFSKPVEDYLGKDPASFHVSWCDHPHSHLDAGLFIVTNTPMGFRMLKQWLAYGYKGKEYLNSDNGILHVLLLTKIRGYRGECDSYYEVDPKKTKVKYVDQRSCVDPWLDPRLDNHKINCVVAYSKHFKDPIVLSWKGVSIARKAYLLPYKTGM
mmetsp:Transcript_8322/g.13549  ORF Transcript_8322/g.13549 Transcript_8322/m.13549 type:complete len:288 (+) Transcript_8322:320-1183(+)